MNTGNEIFKSSTHLDTRIPLILAIVDNWVIGYHTLKERGVRIQISSIEYRITITMPPSCLGCCLPHNHAIHLIKTVYPDHPGEEGPRSSNLSLLVSYAQSKPAKLLKIGKYLEKRLKTDLKKERSGYVILYCSLFPIPTYIHLTNPFKITTSTDMSRSHSQSSWSS